MDLLSSITYRSAWRLSRTMPAPAAYAMFRQIADRTVDARTAGVRQLRRNLGRVTGLWDPTGDARAPRELDDLVRDNLRRYMRYWCDTFRIQDWSHTRLVGEVEVLGLDRLLERQSQGQGTILVAAHQSNWDWAGAFLAARGLRVTTVAERLRPEDVYQTFLRQRRAMGIEVIPHRDREGRRVAGIMDMLGERIDQASLVALVSDRDVGRGGVVVEGFGHQLKVPVGAAVLGARTGAAIMPVTLFTTGADGRHRQHLHIGEPFHLAAGTDPQIGAQRVFDAIAPGIAGHPESWHVLQPTFVADLRRPAATPGGAAAPDPGRA